MAWAHVEGPGAADTACDLVAAAIAEEYLRRDPASLLNIRVSGGHGVLFVAGEIKSQADFDVAAVVRRTLGRIDPALSAEPFISIEQMGESAVFAGSRPLTVHGYATSESDSLNPKALDLAQRAAQALEYRRLNDSDWFWLPADYGVGIRFDKNRSLVHIRLGSASVAGADEMRIRLHDAVGNIVPNLDLRLSVGSDAKGSSLMSNIGSSGRTLSVMRTSAKLPISPDGVGRQIAHPANLGAWYARAAARQLVRAGLGKAVMVEVDWMPFDAKPQPPRARNEKGEDLSSKLDASRFDLASPPLGWNEARLLSSFVRAPFDTLAVLPWES